MNKFLKIDNEFLQSNIRIYPDASIIKNPVPILWNHKGSYYWIPVEIIKNEISNYLLKEIDCKVDDRIITLSLQQAYPLRQDVGKILENFDNNDRQRNNSPQSNSPR